MNQNEQDSTAFYGKYGGPAALVKAINLDIEFLAREAYKNGQPLNREIKFN